MRQEDGSCRLVLERRQEQEGLPYSRLHAGSRRSAAARQRSGGSTDAALLEIEEVLGMRYCDPSQMTAVALNPVDEDDERLEYLVSGRFGSGPDDRGFHSVAWVFDGDLLDHVDAEEASQRCKRTKIGWTRSSQRWRMRATLKCSRPGTPRACV